MATRNQRRKRAAVTRAEKEAERRAIVQSSYVSGKVKANLQKPRERNYYASIPTSVALCEQGRQQGGSFRPKPLWTTGEQRRMAKAPRKSDKEMGIEKQWYRRVKPC